MSLDNSCTKNGFVKTTLFPSESNSVILLASKPSWACLNINGSIADKGFINNINLGSGVEWIRDGWIAIDKCHKSTNDKRVLAIDVIGGELLKHFKDNTVDSIYTSHTLYLL